MGEITLNRTGLRPLVFQGEELASESSHIIAGRDNNRWHEVGLYRHEDGRLILSIGYRTQWQGELEYDEVFVCASAEEVEEQVRITDPCEHLVGFPLGEQYAEKQDRIRKDLKSRFNAIASEVLKSLGPEKI